MAQDIFRSIAELERAADERVAQARARAKALSDEAKGRINDLIQELAGNFEQAQASFEKEAVARREQSLKELSVRMERRLSDLESVRAARLDAVVDRVVRAFLEGNHGH